MKAVSQSCCEDPRSGPAGPCLGMQLLGPKLRISFSEDQPGCFPESLCHFSFIPTSSTGFPASSAFGEGAGSRHLLVCISQRASGLYASCHLHIVPSDKSLSYL